MEGQRGKLLTKTVDTRLENPWDQAHALLGNRELGELEGAGEVDWIEPDFVQQFPYYPAPEEEPEGSLEGASGPPPCSPRQPDHRWPDGGTFAWHLGDDYTQLRSAREAVGEVADGERLRIGILDTGYDPAHSSLPLHLNPELGRNFTDDGGPDNLVDDGRGGFMENPGHGTATMAILAGSEVRDPSTGEPFGILGGAPEAEVVPIRIADGVVHFKSRNMAEGIRHATRAGCRVLSISMGGVPTLAWADAVNEAYESGMAIFAAAGNRKGWSPPAKMVYPARFKRVVGVAGFTANKDPYLRKGVGLDVMQGSFGPLSAMQYAMAAYTPNAPWAKINCPDLVNPNGAGTSSATPQCAAAATLWLQKNFDRLAGDWRDVEALRHALFSSADTPEFTIGGEPLNRPLEYYYGNGLLRASDALAIPYSDELLQTSRDSLSFPILKSLGVLEGGSARGDGGATDRMLEAEALQLFLTNYHLHQLAGDGDPFDGDGIGTKETKAILEGLRDLPQTSNALRSLVTELLTRGSQAPKSSERAESPPNKSYQRLSRLFTTGSVSTEGLESGGSQEISGSRVQRTGDLFGDGLSKLLPDESSSTIKAASKDAQEGLYFLREKAGKRFELRHATALEALAIIDGTRPVIPIKDHCPNPLIQEDAGGWLEYLQNHKEELSQVAETVGAIEAGGSLMGTGWVLDAEKGLVVTNRHVLQLVADLVPDGDREIWTPKADIGAISINFRKEWRPAEEVPPFPQRHRIQSDSWVAAYGSDPIPRRIDLSRLDMAVLRFEPLSDPVGDLGSLPMSERTQLSNAGDHFLAPAQAVYVVGYPKSTRDYTTSIIDKVFHAACYGFKCISPGYVTEGLGEILGDEITRHVFKHDASTLYGSSGSCIAALRPDVTRAVGLHFGGRPGNEAEDGWNFAHGISAIQKSFPNSDIEDDS